MRRKDRERDTAFAYGVIDNAPYVVVGINGENGVYTVPLSIVRDGDKLYFHSALDGRKINDLRHDNRVAITAVTDCVVDENQLTTRYKSAYGEAEAIEITDIEEKKRALNIITERFAPSTTVDMEDHFRKMLSRTAVWCLSLKSLTGKENKPV